jgi:putative transposase
LGLGLSTIVLKLHKPSRAKSLLIDKALLDYNRAFRFLLRNACDHLDEIRSKCGTGRGFTAISLSKWPGPQLMQQINRYDVQPFKDSLKLDFGMTLASYLTLEATDTGARYPDCSDITDNVGSSGLRPIYFCRYDTKRCYCLLYDHEKGRYYAKLYIANSRNARTVSVGGGTDGKLENIHKSGGSLERGRRKEPFIIVPLCFGKRQEKILNAARENPECLRTAKLGRKDGEYYLAICVDTGEAECIKTANFLGVSRGLKNLLNYAVVDQKGTILAQGSFEGKDKVLGSLKLCVGKVGTTLLQKGSGRYEEACAHESSGRRAEAQQTPGQQRRGIPVNELHRTANQIVELAVKYRAQVLVQNLVKKGDGITWGLAPKEQSGIAPGLIPGMQARQNAGGETKRSGKLSGRVIRPGYGMRDYNRLAGLLEYKLPWKGLPPPVKVSSSDIFSVCPSCGYNSKNNRSMRHLFICAACGATMELEKLGSLNLARKLIFYNASRVKIKVARSAEGVRFTNRLLGLDLAVSYREDQKERLQAEIAGIIDRVLKASKQPNNTVKRSQLSVVKKLSGAKNFMDMLEYI